VEEDGPGTNRWPGRRRTSPKGMNPTRASHTENFESCGDRAGERSLEVGAQCDGRSVVMREPQEGRGRETGTAPTESSERDRVAQPGPCGSRPLDMRTRSERATRRRRLPASTRHDDRRMSCRKRGAEEPHESRRRATHPAKSAKVQTRKTGDRFGGDLAGRASPDEFLERWKSARR